MSTQLFRVITRAGLNVRTAARHNAPKVTTAPLVYDDILEVISESCTQAMNYEWWEHAQNRGWWSAARQLNPPETYMIPYQLPHVPPEPTEESVLYEVVTSTLSVRSQPRLGDTIVAGEQLRRGMRLRFRNQTESDGFLWWEQEQHPGWWSASGSLQGGQTFMLPIDETGEVSLSVPWITQIQSPVNLPNDCGHACVWMVMRYRHLGKDKTVEQLYEMPHKNHNGTTNKHHLVLLARDATNSQLELATLDGQAPTPANFEHLKDHLKADRPVILLVYYPSLHFGNPASGNFNHWVVLVGFSGATVYLHDPLWPTETAGARRAIVLNTLLDACSDTHMGLYGVY